MEEHADYLTRMLSSYEDLINQGTILEIEGEIDDPIWLFYRR
jgi:hypothetical protein